MTVDLTNPNLTIAEVRQRVADIFGVLWNNTGEGVIPLVITGIHRVHRRSSPKAAWLVEYDGPVSLNFVPDVVWDMGNRLGVSVIADRRGDRVLLLTSGEGVKPRKEYAPRHNACVGRRVWDDRWGNILGHQEDNRPRPETGVFRTAKAGGVTFHSQPFVVQQGLDPRDYIGAKIEAKIATTLEGSALVSTTPYLNGSTRHSQAFTITWAETESLPLDFEWTLDTAGQVADWVWQHRVNQAFDALGWDRPDLFGALVEKVDGACKWVLTLRLHGAVTPSDVFARHAVLRELLGADEAAVKTIRHGVIITLIGQPA